MCFQITDVLVMMSNATFDIGNLLTIWEKANNIEDLLHFNDLTYQDSTLKINNCFAHEELSQSTCHGLASISMRRIYFK